ncbi:MAG: hypothetical protein M3322_10645 [Actinomycetota bacterium]|nr:hypothetical protein [Actinomycetota bacterium]
MSPRTYAVTWQKGDDGLHSGKAELRARELHLEATGETVEDIRYDDLSGVSIGRRLAERLSGRPTLILERRSRKAIRIASVSQLGIISELAERLAALHLGHAMARNRIAVVLPLREGVHERVRALLADGPPFDPDQAGLEQHQVFVTDHEAVFFFDAAAPSALEHLFSDPEVWIAAAAWQELVGGPARVAEQAFAWARGSDANGSAVGAFRS